MIIPGQSKIACRHIPGGDDTAANAVQIVQADNQGNVNALSMGGLTKLEQGALMIAGHVAQQFGSGELSIDRIDNIAEDSVLLARAVLIEAAPKPAEQIVPQRGNGVLQ